MKRLLTFLILIILIACKSKVVKTKPVMMAITESVYAAGSIKAMQQYQAFATVNGIIKTMYVKEGDSVQIGTPILAISNTLQELNRDNASLAAQYAASNEDKLKDAQQNIALQKNKMENDLLMRQRQQNLWKEDIGTKVELEQRELAYKNSKTLYESAIVKYNDLKKQLTFAASQANKNLQISQQQAGDFTLKSAVNGIVYKLYKEKGEVVNPQTALALVGNNKKFILEMQVDEYDIFKIKQGQQVWVSMDSYKGQVFEARVTNISPMMKESSKTFLVEANFVTPPATLYPFVSFEANIVLETKAKALLIPRKLLLNDSTVVKADGSKVVIKTRLKNYDMVEVVSGITADDELINPVP